MFGRCLPHSADMPKNSKRMKESVVCIILEMILMKNRNAARIQDLELAVDRMKQQQEVLHKKLKDETEQKIKLEVRIETEK